MKKLIIALAFILTSSVTFAQQKIGYINSEELISTMPEYKKYAADLEAYKKTFVDQLTTMQKEFETKYKAYEATAKTTSDEIRQVKEKELSDLQARIQTFQQTAEEKLAAKNQELLNPIQAKAVKAIQDVAKDKNYSYILDESTSSIIYALPSDNIIGEVKTKLGIKETAALPKK
jgi:outer membrane protein